LMDRRVRRAAPATECVRGPRNDAAIVQMKPEKVAPAGVLITDRGNIACQYAKNSPAGVAVFVIRFDIGQVAGFQKLADATDNNQSYAIGVRDNHPGIVINTV